MQLRRLAILAVVSTCLFSTLSFAQTCTNLCLQQTTCDGGGTTSISGTVFAPNGIDPLPNVLVYVPNAPVDAFTPGVACLQAGQPASGDPLVSTTTNTDGTFTLTNMPVGTSIPLVIQTGKWRRQVVINNVPRCVNTAVPATLSRLPKNKAEGDIPQIALVTGSVDALECVLRKVGIDDAEFTNPPSAGGNGRINLYLGAGSAGASVNAATPSESQLFSSQAAVNAYDLVMFACQGTASNPVAQSSTNQGYLGAYADAGGRIFATHYAYNWLDVNPDFANTVQWNVNQGPPPDQTGFVNTTFPKGLTLAQWLQIVHASTTLGQITLNTLRNDQSGVIAPTQSYLTIHSPQEVMQLVFNTPVTAAPADQCGRVLFNEYHVENTSDSPGIQFPNECTAGSITPQERLLEFTLFDLSTAVSSDMPPIVTVGVSNTPASFVQGDAGDTIAINVTNTTLTSATNPSLKLTAVLPPSLTASSMAGTNPNTGWNCNVGTLTCNRTTGLSGGASDPITLIVSVASNAPVGVGAVTVSATASGGGIASNATGQDAITIQGTQAITFTTSAPSSAAYQSNFTVAATGGPSGNPVTFTSSGVCTNAGATYTMTSGTGTCYVIANQAGNANYLAAPQVTQPVNATQLAQAITFSISAPSSAPYQSNFAVAATGGASGNPVIFTSSGVCSNAGGTYTMTSGTGACSVIANQAGDANYSAAPQVTQSVAASQLSQTITFTVNAPSNAAYNSNFTVAASGGGGSNPVTFSSSGACSNAGATYTMTAGVGTCSVIANQAGDANYSAAPQVTQTVNATLAAQTITFTVNAPPSAVYNSNFTVAASGGPSGNPVTFTSSGVCSNAGGTYTTTSGTGTCSVIANQAGNANYSPAPQVTQMVSATLAAQAITFTVNAPSSAVFNSNFTVAASGGASGNPVTFTSSGVCSNAGGTYTMTSGTGTCSVIANQAGNTNYSAAPQVAESVTATLAGQTITFPAIPNQNGPGQITLTATASSNLTVTYSVISGPATVSGNILTTTASGSVTVQAIQSGNGNYAAAPPVSQTFAVLGNAGGLNGSNCNGEYSGTYHGNLTVSSGQICIFSGGGVTGNLTQTGGTVILENNSFVNGNLQMSAGTLNLSNSTVGNDLQITGPSMFTVGPAVVIGGNLQIQNLPASANMNQVCGTSVHGSLTFQNSAAGGQIGSGSGCPGNMVQGNLTVQGNTASTTINSNTVGGNLTDQNNTAATQVFTNAITHSLQCNGNSAITGGANTAASKQGQCATF